MFASKGIAYWVSDRRTKALIQVMPTAEVKGEKTGIKIEGR